MSQFSDFSLPPSLLKACKDLNFTQPTPIQAQSIPVVLQQKDLIAVAQTGSGKTAAYCLPLLSYLIQDPTAVAIILAPTRELARQISDVVRDLTRHVQGMKQAVLIGGVDMGGQIRSLKNGPRMIIATPGRANDHLERGTLDLTLAKFVVLDEGDRMLDMGFAPQINAILEHVPENRQTLLFTATMPPKVRKLAQTYMTHPVSITVGEESKPVETIKQSAIMTSKDKRDNILLDELNKRTGSVIIFAKTRSRTSRLATYLTDFGYTATQIHSDRTQGQRNSALKGFRDGRFRILVATDVAARGIDVPQIAHVINYDLPMFDEDYVHRIGRTARAGAEGEALSFVLPEDMHIWRKLSRKFKIASTGTLGGKGDSKDRPRYKSPLNEMAAGEERPEREFKPRRENFRRERSEFRGSGRPERSERSDRGRDRNFRPDSRNTFSAEPREESFSKPEKKWNDKPPRREESYHSGRFGQKPKWNSGEDRPMRSDRKRPTDGDVRGERAPRKESWRDRAEGTRPEGRRSEDGRPEGMRSAEGRFERKPRREGEGFRKDRFEERPRREYGRGDDARPAGRTFGRRDRLEERSGVERGGRKDYRSSSRSSGEGRYDQGFEKPRSFRSKFKKGSFKEKNKFV